MLLRMFVREDWSPGIESEYHTRDMNETSFTTPAGIHQSIQHTEWGSQHWLEGSVWS